MLITITTARTIIPLVALLIFFSSHFASFYKSHPSFRSSILNVQKKFKKADSS